MKEELVNKKTGEFPNMVKLLPSELQLFNNRGYPRINEDTMELCWYVTKQEYISTIGAYNRTIAAINKTPNRPF